MSFYLISRVRCLLGLFYNRSYWHCPFRHLAELTTKIESRKIQLNQLEMQRTDIKNAVAKEAKSLELQKLAHLRRLEEV